MTSVPVRRMINLLFEACWFSVKILDTALSFVWKSDMNPATLYVVVENEMVDEVPPIVIASLLFAVKNIGHVFGIVANARLYFPSIASFNLNLNFDGTCPEILFRDETTII